MDNPAAIDKRLDLRPADAGANVAILTPFDDVVYERTSKKNGLAGHAGTRDVTREALGVLKGQFTSLLFSKSPTLQFPV